MKPVVDLAVFCSPAYENREVLFDFLNSFASDSTLLIPEEESEGLAVTVGKALGMEVDTYPLPPRMQRGQRIENRVRYKERDQQLVDSAQVVALFLGYTGPVRSLEQVKESLAEQRKLMPGVPDFEPDELEDVAQQVLAREQLVALLTGRVKTRVNLCRTAEVEYIVFAPSGQSIEQRDESDYAAQREDREATLAAIKEASPAWVDAPKMSIPKTRKAR